MKSIFLNLPRELRDVIYHHVLLGQQVSFLEDRLRFHVQYLEAANLDTNVNCGGAGAENLQEDQICVEKEDSNPEVEDDECDMDLEDDKQKLRMEDEICSYSSIPPHAESSILWLLTCRQFLSEGLDQFYTHACCISYIIWERSFSPPDTKLTFDNNISVFTFKRIKKLKLYLKLGHERVQGSSALYDHIVPRGKERLGDSDNDFSILVSHMQRFESCDLEDLKLWVRMFATEPDEYEDDSDVDEERYWNCYGTNLAYPSEVNGYIFDGNFLEVLGEYARLKTVKIQLSMTYMRQYFGDEDSVPANILAIPIVQQSLVDASKHLVLDEQGGYIVQDRLPEGEEDASS